MFTNKIREAMPSSGKNPMDEIVRTEEFFVSG